MHCHRPFFMLHYIVTAQYLHSYDAKIWLLQKGGDSEIEKNI